MLKNREGYIVLVTGSKDATSYDHGKILRETLNMVPQDQPITLVHGGGRGVDKLCAEIAEEKGWAIHIVEADWSIGKSAGPIRNTQMINISHPHYAFAFPLGASIGTRDCLMKLHKYANSKKSRLKIPVVVIELK
jgi:hypothetical protein